MSNIKMQLCMSMLPFIFFDLIDALHHLKEIGFEHIEVTGRNLDYRLYTEDRFLKYLETIQKLELDPIQVHLPYSVHEQGIDISNINEDIRNYSLRIIMKAIDFAHRLGSKYAVLHPGSQEGIDDEYIHQRIVKNVIESCRILYEYSSKKGLILCVENMLASRGKNKPPNKSSENTVFPFGKYRFGASADDLLKIKKAVPGISFCYDTGHPIVNKQDMLREMRKLGSGIAALHINGNDGTWDQHLIPGKRDKVDWGKVIRTLKDIGYQGYFNLEIRRGETRRESLAIAKEAFEVGKKLVQLF